MTPGLAGSEEVPPEGVAAWLGPPPALDRDRDRFLLRRAGAGDDEAFRELYERHHRRVYFFVFRMLGERPAAEDVVVEAFAAAWRQARSFQGRSAVTTWILGIARNLARNELRRRRDHESIDDHRQLRAAERPGVEHSDRVRVIAAAMGRLSSNHREVLDLVFYHELKYAEIADFLDIPAGTVKTRMYHAKAALRGALTELKVSRDAI